MNVSSRQWRLGCGSLGDFEAQRRMASAVSSKLGGGRRMSWGTDIAGAASTDFACRIRQHRDRFYADSAGSRSVVALEEAMPTPRSPMRSAADRERYSASRALIEKL